MDYLIYTYGHGEVLWQILNAVALIVKDGVIQKIMVPLLILSAGWSGFQSVSQGNPLLFLKRFMLPCLGVVGVLYSGTASVMIKDPLSDRQTLSKIDNVPQAIAYLGSLSNSVMLALSEAIETSAAPLASDGLKYTKAGPMFAAHLIGRSRDVRLVDPIARQNIKNFVYQCFTWPFVITNLPPGSRAAQDASDILALVKASPHPGLGVYWRTDQGALFLDCKACVPLVEGVMHLHKKEGLSRLLDKIASSSPSTGAPQSPTKSLFQSYAGQGWQALTAGSQSVFDMVGQQMLINAYREGLDDQRESFHLSRLDPRLVSYQATRAMETQNAGFLINGALIARHLPMLQNVLFGIILFLFILVVPLSMVPGNLRVLGTWVKLLVWCQSWPVFYTILNCVGLMWLKMSLGTVLLEDGGVSILTQNGLSEAAHDAYCLVQNLSMTVPFLSWAVITGSGPAMVSVAERLMAANGASAGANLVDNTYTLDTQQLHTRTIATQTLAQQTLGASLSTGHSVDDGQFRSIQGAGGNVAIHETLSALGTTLSQADMSQNSFAEALGKAEQATLSSQKTFSQAQSAALSNVATLADQWGRGHVSATDLSEGQNLDIRHSFQKMLDVAEKVSGSETANTSTSSSVEGSVKVGTPKALGLLGFEAGITGKTGTAAVNQESVEKLKSAGLSEQDISNINKGLSNAMTHRISSSSDTALRASRDLRGNLDKMESAARQVSASAAKTQSLTHTANFLKSSGSTLNRNMTDDLLAYTAAAHFGGDKQQAARYQREHPDAFKRDVEAYSQGFHDHLISQVMSGHGPSSSTDLMGQYKAYASQVKGEVRDSRGAVTHAQQEAGLSGLRESIFEDFKAGQETFAQAQEGAHQDLSEYRDGLEAGTQKITQEGSQVRGTSTVGRTGKEAGKNLEAIAEADQNDRLQQLEKFRSQKK